MRLSRMVPFICYLFLFAVSHAQSLTVESSDEVTEQVSLASAKATLTLNTVSDVEIRINGNLMGVGTWTGDLDPGIYTVELSKRYFKSESFVIELEEQEKKTYFLPPLSSIFKPLVIISNPSESEVFIDNRKYGITPLFIDSIECGTHNLSFFPEGKHDTIVSIVVSDSIDNYFSATLYKDWTVVKRIEKFETERDIDHEYVDLGLSVKWATCNIGAKEPDESGYSFAWGEIKDKSVYSWSTYNYSERDNPQVKILELKDDIANVRWGGDWRLPTKEEIQELLEKCSWTFTKVKGRNGYKITSKVKGYKGHSIFLPATGCRDNSSHYMIGESGYYWSGTRSDSDSNSAWYLFFDSNNKREFPSSVCLGFSVRPVCP